MEHFAVIDTETNWANQLMSIGVVIASSEDFRPLAAKYYILPDACEIGGMYYDVLFLQTPVAPIPCTRTEALTDLASWLKAQGVERIFAYNAAFDHKLLPELNGFRWFDIMRLAAYRQHNPKIPCTAPLCSTGRMKRGFGVEPMLRLLSGDCTYCETHNALFDAMDELQIMGLLEHRLEDYIPL